MARRIYTGTHPVVFMDAGPAEPGAEFDVPEELLPRFDARADIAEPPGRKAKAKGSTDGADAPDSRQDSRQDSQQETADPGSRAE